MTVSCSFAVMCIHAGLVSSCQIAKCAACQIHHDTAGKHPLGGFQLGPLDTITSNEAQVYAYPCH